MANDSDTVCTFSNNGGIAIKNIVNWASIRAPDLGVLELWFNPHKSDQWPWFFVNNKYIFKMVFFDGCNSETENAIELLLLQNVVKCHFLNLFHGKYKDFAKPSLQKEAGDFSTITWQIHPVVTQFPRVTANVTRCDIEWDSLHYLKGETGGWRGCRET